MSGWNGSDRRERLPSDWPARRARQLARDGHRCTWRLRSGKRCPRTATEVDHIDPMTDDHDRLQSLCTDHHAKKTALEAYKAKRAKKASGLRPTEAHPGRVR